MPKRLQRDVLINYLNAEKELPDLRFITPDFGAAPLDDFRKIHKDKFIFTGIAEQLSVDLAYGIAVAGSRPIVYGMSPFLSARCYEQYKVLFGQSDQPICILPVGVGLGYDHNTCSHYSLDDISLYSGVNGLKIVTPVDCKRSLSYFKDWLENPCKLVIRLERQALEEDLSYEHKLKELPGLGLLLERSSNNLVVTWGKLGSHIIENNLFQNASILLVEEVCTNSSEVLHSYNHVHVTEESYLGTGLFPWIASSVATDRTVLTSSHVDHRIGDVRAHRDTLWKEFGLLDNPF